MRISEFINDYWSEYADYDNKRSLPNLMDGLKTTQRKALYTATTLPKDSKLLRVSQLASKASEMTSYHHAETSMMSTICNLAQDFPGSNNYPLLQKHGQFGSRLSPIPGQPRYIHTKLHDNWNKLFNDEDNKIIEYLKDEENENIEPKFFIPILPTILINASNGVGNGFASFIFSYTIESIQKCLMEIIDYGEIKSNLIPYIKNWHGTIERNGNQLFFTGKYKILSSTKISVTELPYTYDNDKYKQILNNLINENIINDYDNASTEDGWDWTLYCNKEFTKRTNEEIIDILQLKISKTQNIVCWGVNTNDGPPLKFDSPEDLLTKWYHERIQLHQKAITNTLDELMHKIVFTNNKSTFLELCLNSNFKKMTKQDLINLCKTIKNISDEEIHKFINIPLYKITTDQIDILNQEIQDLLSEYDLLKSSSVVDHYKTLLKQCSL